MNKTAGLQGTFPHGGAILHGFDACRTVLTAHSSGGNSCGLEPYTCGWTPTAPAGCVPSAKFTHRCEARKSLRRTLMHHCLTKALAAVTAAAITLLPAGPAFAGEGGTATPIKHVVVIFQENVSFDHYFGTYPHATKNS